MKTWSVVIFFLCIAGVNLYAEEEKVLTREAVAGIEKRLENIEKKFSEKKLPKNHLVTVKDIDFLYDAVVDGDYLFVPPVKAEGVGDVMGIYEGHWYQFYTDSHIKINAEGVVTEESASITKYKLCAIEKTLGLQDGDFDCETDDSKSKQVERIQKVYEELNYSNWDEDRVRFMVLTNYISGLESMSYNIGVMAFPSYKKYRSGDLDLLNRYAVYIAAGNSTNQESVEVDGTIYSVGINIELQDGFGLNIGYATYYGRTAETDDFQHGESVTYGITLSSDLWKSLFGG